jgi:hypothetical protein
VPVAAEGDTVAVSVTLAPVATDELETVRVVVVEVVPELLEFELPPHPNMISAQSTTDISAIERIGTLELDGVWATKSAVVDTETGTDSGLILIGWSFFAKIEVDAKRICGARKPRLAAHSVNSPSLVSNGMAVPCHLWS